MFKTVFRKAEQSDARLEIRREEKDNQKRKKQEKDEEKPSIDLWEDTTFVSISALRAFLIDFLKSHGDDALKDVVPAKSDNVVLAPTPPQSANTANIQAIKAQQAYAAVSVYAADIHTNKEPPPPIQQTSLSDLLKSDEIRTMHILITELNDLEQKGVQTLVIEKAETFLQALVFAVEKEKSNF